MLKYLDFKRNSINLLVGPRGSGKTFNVMKQLTILVQKPGCEGYTSFLLITDKDNDNTIDELLTLVQPYMKVKKIKYANPVSEIMEMVEAKNVYFQVDKYNLEPKLTDKSKEKILKVSVDDDFYKQLLNTIIMFDDAINVMKEKKYQPLVNLLFQNRQERYIWCSYSNKKKFR
jgi:energy-coupling factor transporter ATP-binding protein EcfA2